MNTKAKLCHTRPSLGNFRSQTVVRINTIQSLAHVLLIYWSNHILGYIKRKPGSLLVEHMKYHISFHIIHHASSTCIDTICYSITFLLTQNIEVDWGDGGNGDVVVTRDTAQLRPSQTPDKGSWSWHVVTLTRCHLGIQEDRRRDTTREGGVTDIETDIRGEVDEEEEAEEQVEVVIWSSISSESFSVQVTFGVGRPRLERSEIVNLDLICSEIFWVSQ